MTSATVLVSVPPSIKLPADRLAVLLQPGTVEPGRLTGNEGDFYEYRLVRPPKAPNSGALFVVISATGILVGLAFGGAFGSLKVPDDLVSELGKLWRTTVIGAKAYAHVLRPAAAQVGSFFREAVGLLICNQGCPLRSFTELPKALLGLTASGMLLVLMACVIKMAMVYAFGRSQTRGDNY